MQMLLKKAEKIKMLAVRSIPPLNIEINDRLHGSLTEHLYNLNDPAF